VRCWNRQGQNFALIDVRSWRPRCGSFPSGQACSSVMTGLQKAGPEPFSSGLQRPLPASQKLNKAPFRQFPARPARPGRWWLASANPIESSSTQALAPSAAAAAFSPCQSSKRAMPITDRGARDQHRLQVAPPSATSAILSATMQLRRRRPGSIAAAANPCRPLGQPIQAPAPGRTQAAHWCPNGQHGTGAGEW